MDRQYYLAINELRKGPYAKDELLSAGMQPDTLVWYEGLSEWRPAHELRELAGLLSERSMAQQSAAINAGILRLYPESYLNYPFTAGWVLWTISFCWMFIVAIVRDMGVPFVISLGGPLLNIFAGCVFLIFWYRCLVIIQDGKARLTPVATIGFLLIPVFQFYWIFRATVGVARELNYYAERRRLRAPRASVLLGVAVSIYFVFAVIPFLGFLAALLNLLLFPLFMHSIYHKAICFCADKRIVEEDTAKIDRAKLEQDWLPSGVLAVILAPFGLLLCQFGCLLTPFRQPQVEAIAKAFMPAGFQSLPVGVVWALGGFVLLAALWFFEIARAGIAADGKAAKSHGASRGERKSPRLGEESDDD